MKSRVYTISDRDVCLALFDANTPTFFDPADREEFREFLEHMPPCEFRVFEQQGRVVACGGWYENDRQEIGLVWGMVDRPLHGLGLGKKLLRELVDAAMQHSDAKSIIIHTTQVVQPFFEKVGFRATAVEPDGFGTGLDAVTMEMKRPQTR